jgi:hypothetical protein
VDAIVANRPIHRDGVVELTAKDTLGQHQHPEKGADMLKQDAQTALKAAA